MSTRTVNINYPNGPDPRAIAWLIANGVDPNNVLGEQEVLIAVGPDHAVMGYVEFIRDEGGQKILGGHGYLKQIIVTPMLSAPENHGL